MHRIYSKMATLLVAIFICQNTFGEADWNVSLSGSAKGAEDQAEAVLKPEAGVMYQQRNWQINSQWLAELNTERADSWPPNWTASNVLSWHSPTQFVSTELSYVRDDDTEDFIVHENVSALLSFLIPWTPTVTHIAGLRGRYQSTELDSDLKTEDESLLLNYGLSWAANAKNRWQINTSHQRYDSGSNVSTIGLNLQNTGARVQLNNSITANWVEKGDDSNQVLGFQSEIAYTGNQVQSSITLSRTQTDALNFFDTSFDEPVEEQNQLTVDQLSWQFNNLELFRRFYVNGGYLVGESRSTISIESLNSSGFSSSGKYKFKQTDLGVAYPYGDRKQLKLIYNDRTENQNRKSALTAQYTTQPSSKLTLSLELEKSLKPDDSVSWLGGFTYRF